MAIALQLRQRTQKLLLPPRRKGVKGERKLTWIRGRELGAGAPGPGPSPLRKGCDFPWPRASLHTPVFGYGWNELSPCQPGPFCGLWGLDCPHFPAPWTPQASHPGLSGHPEENSGPSLPVAFPNSAWWWQWWGIL